jgi:hypothetical protein
MFSVERLGPLNGYMGDSYHCSGIYALARS